MAEERPNMFARVLDNVQRMIRPDYSQNREVQRAAALAIATDQRELIDFARKEAVDYLAKLAEIPVPDRDTHLKLERIDPGKTSEWSAEDWADKAKLVAKVEADVVAWAKDNKLDLKSHDDRFAAYVGVGSAYGAAHLSVNFREWEKEYRETRPEMTEIGGWKIADEANEYRLSVAVIDGKFHPAVETSYMGCEATYSHSDVAFDTARETRAVAQSYYAHVEFGEGDEGFRREIAELGQVRERQVAEASAEAGTDAIAEYEARFPDGDTRMADHIEPSADDERRTWDDILREEAEELGRRTEEQFNSNVDVEDEMANRIDRAEEAERFEQWASERVIPLSEHPFFDELSDAQAAAQQQEAVTAGREAEARGESVIYVHGRPFADPGHDVNVSPTPAPNRDPQAVIAEALAARITTAFDEMADAVIAGERPQFRTEEQAAAFRRDVEAHYGQGAMERLRSGDSTDLSRDVSDPARVAIMGAAVRMMAETHEALRDAAPDRTLSQAAVIDRESGPDLDL